MTPPIHNKWCSTHPGGKLHKNIQAATGNKLVGFVIHQTANLNAGADAEAHAKLQFNGNVRVASWHATVDDREVWRSWQKQVRCWSAGTGALDYYAVELCVNSDGDYVKTLKNAASFIAWVHVHEGVPLVLKQHNSFTGKNCPTQIRASQGGISWARFCALVRDEVAILRGGAAPTPAPAPTPAKPAAPWRGAMGWPVLAKGAKGADVTAFQSALIALGYSCGTKGADGSFGDATDSAARAWQKAAGLVDDGRIGEKSQVALKAGKGRKAAAAPAKPAAPAPAATPTLKVGSKGGAVEKLQRDLNRVFPSYSKLVPDGDFGAKTKSVVAEFQRRSGLSPDGVVGPKTWAALAKHGVKP